MSLPTRTMYIVLALVLVIGLAGIAMVPSQADAGTTNWTKVGTPSETDNVLLPGSDIYDMAVGPDGETIYAVGSAPEDYDSNGEPDGPTVPKLWKSTDGGATWSDKTSKVIDALDAVEAFDGYLNYDISFVAVAPDDGDLVAIAGNIMLVPDPTQAQAIALISDNGATSFSNTGLEESAVPGDFSWCVDVSKDVSGTCPFERYIAIGTTNYELDEGKGFILELGGLFSSWKEASDSVAYPGWQDNTIWVNSLTFSPNFQTDKTLVISSTYWAGNGDPANSTQLQMLKWSSGEKAWNGVAGFAGYPLKVDGLIGLSDIALPDDFMGGSSASRVVYMTVSGIDWMEYLDKITTGLPIGPVSHVYIVEGASVSVPVGPGGNPLLWSIDVSGTSDDAKCMVGEMRQPHSVTATAIDISNFGDFMFSFDAQLTRPMPCCTGVGVWYTTNIDPCCPDWNKARKSPTGQGFAIVSYTPDGDKAYTVTSGTGNDESAFSVSLDEGMSWNQIGLIDTWISWLDDVMVSPDCNTKYVVSINAVARCENPDESRATCDSVWRIQTEADDYAGVWQRVWCGDLVGDGNAGHGLLRLIPGDDEGKTIWLADAYLEWRHGEESNRMWSSGNSGQWWDSVTASSDIMDFALDTDETIYVLSPDGNVAKSTDDGWNWTPSVATKTTDAHTILVKGDYVLVGGWYSKVSYSDDAGGSFSALGSPFYGAAHVAFDTYFDENDTIYAAVGYGDNGIYRWVIGSSESWTNLNAEDFNYTGIALELSQDGNPLTSAANGGVLYASYTWSSLSSAYSGVARNLTPAAERCCGSWSWDYLECGLSEDEEEFETEPSSLRLCGCLTPSTNTHLFAIDWGDYNMSDGKNGTVWTWEDCFAKAAPELMMPDDGSMIPADPCACTNGEMVLKWERQCNACSYDIQVAKDEGFEVVVLDSSDFGASGHYYPPSGADPSAVIEPTQLECSRTYYWRVRVADAEPCDQVVHSFWSEARSFTVEAGPGADIQLTSPDNGTSNVPVSGVGFTWTAVSGADSYNFVLSASSDLSSPVESQTGLTGTALTYSGSLDNDATYYWQVEAMKDGGSISTSATSTFRTAPVPPETPTPTPTPTPEPTTPAWVWVLIGIGAVLVIVVIVLIFRTRRV